MVHDTLQYLNNQPGKRVEYPLKFKKALLWMCIEGVPILKSIKEIRTLENLPSAASAAAPTLPPAALAAALAAAPVAASVAAAPAAAALSNQESAAFVPEVQALPLGGVVPLGSLPPGSFAGYFMSTLEQEFMSALEDGSASVTTVSTASVTTEDTLLADFADFGDNLD